jgi:hypothetical protein
MNTVPSPVHGPSAGELPVEIPAGHVGPVVLPGTGRQIYWTGRVAIGLRHIPDQSGHVPGSSALWIQDLMLNKQPPLF